MIILKDTYEKDAERINQQIDLGDVETKDDYEKKLKKFLGKTPTQAQLNAFWNSQSTQKFIKIGFFKRAGGKNLNLDKKKQHKVILTNPNIYAKNKARRSDLKGLDTRRAYGYTTIKGVRRRRKIDPIKTRVVQLKAVSYSYIHHKSKKLCHVNKKERMVMYVYDKKGKRLSLRR